MNIWTVIVDTLSTWSTNIWTNGIMDHATYISIRSSLFTAFLSLGGLMLTALSFITTRIHDLMKTDAYKERTRKIATVWPNAPFASHLRGLSRPTKWIVGACFFSAGLQFTLGLWNNRIAEHICLFIPLATLCAVSYVAVNSIRVYEKWLDTFEADITKEATKRQAS